MVSRLGLVPLAELRDSWSWLTHSCVLRVSSHLLGNENHFPRETILKCSLYSLTKLEFLEYISNGVEIIAGKYIAIWSSAIIVNVLFQLCGLEVLFSPPLFLGASKLQDIYTFVTSSPLLLAYMQSVSWQCEAQRRLPMWKIGHWHLVTLAPSFSADVRIHTVPMSFKCWRQMCENSSLFLCDLPTTT